MSAKLNKTAKHTSVKNIKTSVKSTAVKSVVKLAHSQTSSGNTETNHEASIHQYNEMRLQYALEGSNQGVWDWNLITNEVYYSPKWKELIGYKDDELENNFEEWKSRVYPDDWTKISDEIKKTLRLKNYDYNIEHRLLCKNGSYKWIEARGKVLEYDKRGRPARMVGTHTDIAALKHNEEALQRSEEKYRALVENSPVVIMTTDEKEIITFINFDEGESTTEYIIGKSLYKFLKPEYHVMVKRCHKNVFLNKGIETYETESVDEHGEQIWMQTQVGPIFSGKKVTGLTLFKLNITTRKNAEEKIKQSLKEKEVLLKEVHHRVKNNLQIISSILNLQTSKSTSKKTLEIIYDSQKRIKAMSLIHELLYQSDDFSRINFSEYLNEILTNLMSSYVSRKPITLELDSDKIFLNLDVSIPCGLLINELVTNAMKYAFTNHKKGILTVSLKRKDGKIVLRIADNGKGLPAHIDFKKTNSLGMQLVIGLTDQIDGTIELDNSNGAAYTITFKEV